MIYLVLNNYSTVKIEYFGDAPTKNPNAIKSIASHLGISENRIKKYREVGNSSNTNNFYIEFEIHPRGMVQKSDPLIVDLKTKLSNFKRSMDPFNIKTVDGKNLYLVDIKYDEITRIIPTPGPTVNPAGFINPAWEGSIKYLKYKQSGFPEDPDLDPVYSLDKGQVVKTVVTTPPARGYSLIDALTRLTNRRSSYRGQQSVFSGLPGETPSPDEYNYGDLDLEDSMAEINDNENEDETNEKTQTQDLPPVEVKDPTSASDLPPIMTEEFRSYI